MTPDGVAYLDLSDAFLRGDWGGFVNLYWSPLYPTLIGLARLVAHPSAYWEFATVHAVNVVLFGLSLAAFEWFLTSLQAVAVSWPDSILPQRWTLVAAYVLFGTVSLTMTTMELPTPDLLVTAAALSAFGALLRVRAKIRPTRNAMLLGFALGVGALAKSFLVPWGLVCLATLAVATRRGGARPLLAAVGAWLIVVGPWTAIMSERAHHLSFGETGRLTYIWYVNSQFSPTSGAAPPAASAPEPNAVFPGVAATGDAPGTNPLWLDPTRWYAGLSAHFSMREQLENVRVGANYYVRNLAPLLLLLVMMLAMSPPSGWLEAWRRGWVVFVPVAAAMVAYALVIVTARYVAGFLIAGTLLLVAAVPRPDAIKPVRLAAGVLIVLLMEMWATNTTPTLTLILAGLAGVVLICLTRMKLAYAIPMGVVLALVLIMLLLPAPRAVLLAFGGAVVVMTFMASKRLQRIDGAAGASHRFGLAFAAFLLLMLLGRVAQRFWRDGTALARPNTAWLIARDLQENGVPAGTRILLVGPADQGTWARPARLRITAEVPTWRVPAFWALPEATRDSLLARFADTGAQIAVASVVASTPMSGWRVIKSGGWLRSLPATAR